MGILTVRYVKKEMNLPNKRRLPPKTTDENIRIRVNTALKAKGVENHYQAKYFTELSKFLMQQNLNKFDLLKPQLKIRDTQQWQTALEFCISFLKNNNATNTLSAIQSELNGRETNYPGLFSQDPKSVDVYFRNLLKISREQLPVPFAKRVRQSVKFQEKAMNYVHLSNDDSKSQNFASTAVAAPNLPLPPSVNSTRSSNENIYPAKVKSRSITFDEEEGYEYYSDDNRKDQNDEEEDYSQEEDNKSYSYSSQPKYSYSYGYSYESTKKSPSPMPQPSNMPSFNPPDASKNSSKNYSISGGQNSGSVSQKSGNEIIQNLNVMPGSSEYSINSKSSSNSSPKSNPSQPILQPQIQGPNKSGSGSVYSYNQSFQSKNYSPKSTPQGSNQQSANSQGSSFKNAVQNGSSSSQSVKSLQSTGTAKQSVNSNNMNAEPQNPSLSPKSYNTSPNGSSFSPQSTGSKKAGQDMPQFQPMPAFSTSSSHNSNKTPPQAQIPKPNSNSSNKSSLISDSSKPVSQAPYSYSYTGYDEEEDFEEEEDGSFYEEESYNYSTQ